MNQYTIYCTEEQTRKAFELGAPILSYNNAFVSDSLPHYVEHIDGDRVVFVIPTAEQMLGWLEEQDNIVSIEISEFEGYWSFYVITVKPNDSIYSEDYETRQEATIAAIDAALNYLTAKKGE